MILFGVEVPLAPNEQVYAVDEQRGQIGLCDFTVDSAVRRSLVRDTSDDSGDTELRDVLGQALASAKRPACWVVTWHLNDQHHSEVQLRLFERKLQSAGYLITRAGSLGIGELTLDGLPLPVLPPGVAWGRCGWFIGLGLVRGQLAALPALLPTLHMLATTRRLQPSREFIATLTSAGSGFLYSALDERDATAWILVEAAENMLTINEGMLSRTFYGQEAPNAWRGAATTTHPGGPDTDSG